MNIPEEDLTTRLTELSVNENNKEILNNTDTILQTEDVKETHRKNYVARMNAFYCSLNSGLKNINNEFIQKNQRSHQNQPCACAGIRYCIAVLRSEFNLLPL